LPLSIYGYRFCIPFRQVDTGQNSRFLNFLELLEGLLQRGVDCKILVRKKVRFPENLT
jgi:hypothetical protein